MSVGMSVICLSVCVCVSVCLSVCMYVCMSACLSYVCLSVCVCVIIFSFQSMLHNWCNKGCGMYCHVWDGAYKSIYPIDGLCYTSCGALAGKRNSSMGPS